MKIKAIALAPIALMLAALPAAAQYTAQPRPGASCSPYGCRQTATLWSYGVPGAAVGYYQWLCNSRSSSAGRAYAAVRPGQIWGSNVVTCYYEGNSRTY
jgi:hypothetical protein